jgi:hypothetical protein
LVLFAFVTLVCLHSPTKFNSGASILLHCAQMSLWYWTMPRNLQNSLTPLGRINARITCTFFFCSLIPSRDKTYPRYSVSVAQNNDLCALTFSRASRNPMKTLFSLLRWSSRLPLVMHNRSSI